MTLEEIKQTSPFAMGGENVDYAQYFDGTSYLNMLSLKQVIVATSRLNRPAAIIGTSITPVRAAVRCC